MSTDTTDTTDDALHPGGRRSIDLNADLGESFGAWSMGDDAAMLDVVSSANVACGFHAGDPLVMQRTVAAAAERGVAVGAHVAYRDLAGFGRRFMDVAPAELIADILAQLGALSAMCRLVGTEVTYVKPHGALYNAIVHHEAQAAAVVEAVRLFNPSLSVMCLPGSRVLELAGEAGLGTVAEAFADRAYTPEGTLVSRREPGSVLHDADEVATRMLTLATTGTVTAIDGTPVPVAADSICTHGDSPDAVAMARAVRARLEAAGVTIGAFS